MANPFARRDGRSRRLRRHGRCSRTGPRKSTEHYTENLPRGRNDENCLTKMCEMIPDTNFQRKARQECGRNAARQSSIEAVRLHGSISVLTFSDSAKHHAVRHRTSTSSTSKHIKSYQSDWSADYSANTRQLPKNI